MRKFLLLTIFFFVYGVSIAQVLNTNTYTEDASMILNPERGFYFHSDSYPTWPSIFGQSYQPLTEFEVNYYLDSGATVVLRLFYLHEFLNSDTISQAYKNKMQDDFDLIRDHGMKVMIRFAYSNLVDSADMNVTPERIESHLISLNPILAANKDLILAVQAGFIGTWGEWYYTDNFGAAGTIYTQSDWEKRYQVITALLENVPPGIMIQLRAPAYKTNYLQYIGEATNPVSDSEAFNPNLVKARLGHHNDCFMSGPDAEIHEITIPKSSLTALSDTIYVGVRGMGITGSDTTLYGGSSFSQLPYSTSPLEMYVLGSESISGGWDYVSSMVDFTNGTILEFKVADDGSNVYIRIQESGYLALYGLRYDIVVNTDEGVNTGYSDTDFWTASGADYLVQKYNGSPVKLYSHTGSGFTWNEVSGSGISSSMTYVDNIDDQGTYTSQTDIDYVAADTKYVISGGESCGVTNQNGDCMKVVDRLDLHNYTYLNYIFHQEVIGGWRTDGCLFDIRDQLGYRLKLNSVAIQDSVSAGNSLFVNLNLTNSGFAAPSKLRPIYLVLKDTMTSAETQIKFISAGSDIRTWQTGGVSLNESLTIPAGLAPGTYELSLNFPDIATALSANPMYSIHLANTGVWESTTGYNKLGMYIVVKSPSPSSTSPSIVVDGYLTDWDSLDYLAIGNDSIQFIKAYDIQDTLYISAKGTFGNGYRAYIDADGKSYTGFSGLQGAEYKIQDGKIYRFEWGDSWVEVADDLNVVASSSVFEIAVPKNLLYGLEEVVKIGFENLVSGVTSSQLPEQGNLFPYPLNYPLEVARPAVSITANGNSSDWAYVDPLATSSGSIQLMKVFDDQTNVYLLLKGSLTTNVQNHQTFINTDNNSATGFDDAGIWLNMGADIAIISGALYTHDPTTALANSGNAHGWGWSFVSSAITVANASDSATQEIVVPKSLLPQLDPGSKIDVGYRTLTSNGFNTLAKIPGQGGLAEYSIESPYVQNLQSLVLSDDLANLSIRVQGGVITSTYQVLLNSDNNTATGYADGATNAGADYLIENGSLYTYTGDGSSYSWSWVSAVSAQDTMVSSYLHQRIITIAKTSVNVLAASDTITISYRNTVAFAVTDKIPGSGMLEYVTSKPYVPELESIDISDDGTNLYISVVGSNVSNTYEAYVNTDNGPTTGYIDAGIWSTMGADFLIQNGQLFSYSGTSNQWGWTSVPTAIQVTTTQLDANKKQKTLAIPRVALSELGEDSIITVGFRNLISGAAGAKIPGTGGMKPDTIQFDYVSDLQEMVITDDSDSVYVEIYGGNILPDYDLFINADEANTTGYISSNWTTMGADLLVENGTLYTYSGTSNSWGWTSSGYSVSVVNTEIDPSRSKRRIAIPRVLIGSSILSIKVGYASLDNYAIVAKLPADGDMAIHVLTPLNLSIGEVGKISASQTGSTQWHTVNLTGTYTNPVVIMSPLSYNNNAPATLRVKSVTSTSFQYQIDEWDYLDGAHPAENFFYFVVEAGIYELNGGVIMQAGTTQVNQSWTTVPFLQEFESVPLTFAQTTTVIEASAVSTRIRYIGTEQFELKVQEEEGNNGTHSSETVSWIALTEGTGNVGRSFEVDGTDRQYDHIFFEKWLNNSYEDPIVLAHMQTAYGKDPAALRYKDLDSEIIYFKVEEEQSGDFETNHTNEEIGFMVFDSAGLIYGTEIFFEEGRESESQDQELLTNSAPEILIFPNPVIDMELRLTGAAGNEFTNLVLFDLSGRLMLERKNISDNERIIFEDSWRGIYILKLSNASGDSRSFRVLR